MNIKARMKGIEEQIGIITTAITHTQTKLYAMEKNMCTNKMGNKVK